MRILAIRGICHSTDWNDWNCRPLAARAGSVASSTVSGGGSLSGEISDNIEDDEGEDFSKSMAMDAIPVVSVASSSSINTHTPTHRASSSDTEKRRIRPATVPLRKSLSQGGVPEVDQVNQTRGNQLFPQVFLNLFKNLVECCLILFAQLMMMNQSK